MLVSAATELSEQQGSEVHRAHGAYVRKLMRLRRLMLRAAHARACTALTREREHADGHAGRDLLDTADEV